MNSKYLEALFQRYQNGNNIQRVLWVKEEPAVPEGENYLSTVTRASAGVITGSGQKRTVSVVIKYKLEADNEWVNESGLFNNEIKTYSNILNRMAELMHEFEDNRETLWPDMIGYQPNTIIFEDLKKQNFELIDRRQCLDLVHCKLCVRNLARYHAMSRILIQRKYVSTLDVKPYVLLISEDFIMKHFGNGLKVLVREMRTWDPQWSEISEKILKFSDSLPEKLFKLKNDIDIKNFNVINHGDCYNNNILFKYDGYNNTPIAIKFIDFQLSHYQSFAWDLTYFLYSAIRGDLRREYYNELITDYAKSLNDTLLQYSYPENEVPSLEQINREMEKLLIFAVPICTLTHAFLTMPVKNSYNMMEGLKPEKYENCGYNLEIFRGTYEEEIGPDIRRFAQLGVY